MSTTERLQREGRRSECYRLLAALFYPPERSRLLAEETCRQLAELVEELYPEAGISSSAAVMQQQLGVGDETGLRVDHAALFVGPFELKAAPYGSVYLEEGRRLMGDSTMAVIDLYREAGLQLEMQEAPDHIIFELEFMHYLTAVAAEALAAGHEDTAAEFARKQHRFLKEHLGAWVPRFCAAISREAELPYFRTLGDCLLAFVRADLHHLEHEAARAR